MCTKTPFDPVIHSIYCRPVPGPDEILVVKSDIGKKCCSGVTLALFTVAIDNPFRLPGCFVSNAPAKASSGNFSCLIHAANLIREEMAL